MPAPTGCFDGGEWTNALAVANDVGRDDFPPITVDHDATLFERRAVYTAQAGILRPSVDLALALIEEDKAARRVAVARSWSYSFKTVRRPETIFRAASS